MPLLSSVDGVGTLTQASVSSREYTVGESDDFAVYNEVERTEVRVWTGISKSAAEFTVNQNAQPADGVNSWSASLDDPILQSYTVQKVFSNRTNTLLRTGGA